MSGMLPFPLLHLPPLDPRVIILPLLLGLGMYLILSWLPVGRPKPDLGERLSALDVDERIRQAEWGRRASTPLFSSRLLEGMLRPIIDDTGRVLGSALARL